MRRMRADMSQMRLYLPCVRADLPHVQPDMIQIRPYMPHVRAEMPQMRLHMRQIRADMSQVKPHLPHVKADIGQIQCDMEQMRPAVSADRLCKMSVWPEDVFLTRRLTEKQSAGIAVAGVEFGQSSAEECSSSGES
jgi:hypothetical protein